MSEIPMNIKRVLNSFNGELKIIEKMTIKDLDEMLLEEYDE
jgi:hypothetical protein